METSALLPDKYSSMGRKRSQYGFCTLKGIDRNVLASTLRQGVALERNCRGVSEERVDDTQARELLAVLKILAIENAALAFDGRGNDQGVVPGKAMFSE